jgi:hypothetical protein
MKTAILGAAALAAFAAVPLAAQQADAPMRHRQAGPVTRADFQQRLHAHFASLDANHDGFVDRAEAGSGKGWMHGGGDGAGAQRMHMEPGAMFDSMDANHDGSISRDEFLARHGAGRHHGMAPAGAAGADGTARPMHARHARMGMGFGGRWFDRADADHDGRVSQAEADASATAMFDRLDANRDGTIAPEERAAGRDRMRQGMAGQSQP